MRLKLGVKGAVYDFGAKFGASPEDGAAPPSSPRGTASIGRVMRVFLGVTGASGAPYAARALSATDFVGKKTLKEAVNELERRIITDALRRAGGVQTRASEILGTTRRILRYRMQQLGIE